MREGKKRGSVGGMGGREKGISRGKRVETKREVPMERGGNMGERERERGEFKGRKGGRK